MRTIINDILPFNLEIIAEGGQAFRWNRQQDGKYIGVVGNHVFEIFQNDDELIIDSNDDKKITVFLKEYFDVYRDYEQDRTEMMSFEELIPAVNYCSGYRILFQDPWKPPYHLLSQRTTILQILKRQSKICVNYMEAP